MEDREKIQAQIDFLKIDFIDRLVELKAKDKQSTINTLLALKKDFSISIDNILEIIGKEIK